jgi:putative transposase
MAPPRIEVVGHTYHVNSKSVDGTKLFVDEDDRVTFLRMLRAEARRSDWCVLAYSLMTTHFHVLLELRKLTLSSGFQRLKSLYAREYNRRHGRRGALWQRRFYDAMVDGEAHLYESIRYIALNAPRANACPTPEAWQWCGYGSAIGLYPRDAIVDEEELLRLFGTSPKRAREELRAYVEERDSRVRLGQTRVSLRSDGEE